MDDKIIEATIKALEKDFEKGVVIRGDSVEVYDNVLSTGSIGLDMNLGIGGYPMGSVVELYGLPGAGKSTMALHAVAEAQKLGYTALYVDVEHALDPNYAEQLGVDLTSVLIAQPRTAEEALTIVEKMAKTGQVQLVVIDSVAALIPKAELEADVGKDHVARLARIMSEYLKRIVSFVHEVGCLIIFINQIRMNIGMYQAPTTTSGGLALKFYAHVRLDVKAKDKIRDGEEVIGNKVSVQIIKNKHAPPYRTATFNLIFGKGIDTYGELLDFAMAQGVVTQSGAWFKFGEDNTEQGRFNAISYLMDNPELCEQIKRNIYGKDPTVQVEAAEESNADD